MKKIIKIATLTLLTTASTVYASGDRTIAFSIPASQYCDNGHGSELSISITNISSESAQIKLSLYKKDGTISQLTGSNNNGIISDLNLNQTTILNARETTNYHVGFLAAGAGPGNGDCSERVFHGEITVSGHSGKILASGWQSGRNLDYFRSGATVIINGGKPF